MGRIAFLDQYAGLGGGQRVLLDLAHFFREAGDEVSVYLPGDGSTAMELRQASIPVLDLPLPAMTPGKKGLLEKISYPLHAWRASRALLRSFGPNPPDLLYANGPRTFLPAVLAARSAGMAVFCALHLIFQGGAERRLIRWCFRRPSVKGILFCSRATAAPFKEFEKEKGLLAPYWVSPRFLSEPPRRGAFRGSAGIPEGALLAGVIGRISATKGQRFFIQALAPLLLEFPSLHLVVAGSADFEKREEEKALEDIRASSPDPARIHLVFEMVDSLSFMDSLDVLVVPSLWEEPFGLVAVEGMARRLPVVVTRSGGLAETVREGETGFVVEKRAEDLRAAIGRLLRDRALREAMGRAGRARCEAFHAPEACLKPLRERVWLSAGGVR